MTNGDFVRSFNSWDEITYLLIQPERASVHEPQNGGRCELHRHGSNVKPRCSSVRNTMFPVGKAISLLENNFPSPLNEHVPRKVPALRIRLKIRINSLCGGIALRDAHTGTESDDDRTCQWPDEHKTCEIPFNS